MALKGMVITRNAILTTLAAARVYTCKIRFRGIYLDTTEKAFHCDVDSSTDEKGLKTVTVRCHGRLVNQTGSILREAVKPLIAQGGTILVDLTDVSFMDSMGLGTLVGLKVSAVNEGYCTLTLLNLTPRIQELIRLTHLTSLFGS
jgi:anti-anti-sigma factor